ncbi:DnaA/Hda family protein [Marinicella sp. S1101]|uniref:HdaA/DnaA family protein n=1 Tax=Marinicella marina TaxID=2996016 RepID=UPI0022609171|nr:DnaA/Hda family protein [Marinicella marina]MCX7554993.1 DnaA/Hda family protein [Marinicella marina]MDJ1141343.1 DnaA/Hda family protein [Marinicella marina]
MTQQAALPFKNQSLNDFAHFSGNPAVVEVLKAYQQLPQFTYIHGPQYSGKTHVLNAMEQWLTERSEAVFLVQSESLMQLDMSMALPKNVSFVLIEDIDKLAGEPAGELALFNFFNHCKNYRIHLLISSCIDANHEAWGLPDLSSRLNSGLTLKLKPLAGEKAFECLAQQFKFNGIPVEKAVIQFLQTHYSSAYPKLYQVFLALAVSSLQQKRKVTVPLVKSVIAQQSVADS